MFLALSSRTALDLDGLHTAFAGSRVDHAGWTLGLGVETVQYLGGGGAWRTSEFERQLLLVLAVRTHLAAIIERASGLWCDGAGRLFAHQLSLLEITVLVRC